jgi:hypothetical protein
MRRRFLLFCMLSLSTVFIAPAQTIFTVNGVISKKLTVERISQALVVNLRSRDLMMSDEIGWFSIKAAIGDTLLVSKADYTDQKIVIINSSDIPVYMQPVIKLAEVKIQGQTKKQELAEVMADYRKQGTFYNGKPPITSFLTNPLTGIYELFGATPGRARRFAANSKSELEYAEVRRRYTLTLVKRVTHAPDSAAKKFMAYYTPTFDDLKEWNDYELINHVKKSYEYYEINKERVGPRDLDFFKKE